MKLERLLRIPAGQALGLMAMRSTTIAAKFALTLFITRYLGLAELGLYGIITSIAALAPVLLGFGVASNLAREAARCGPSAVTLPVLQYFLFLVPAYLGLGALSLLVWPERASWIGVMAALLLLEHLQTEMFTLMTLAGSAFWANVVYFIRFAGWTLVYIPLALVEPDFRNLAAVVLFWVGGCVVATLVALVCTLHWRWDEAARALPRARLRLPHNHGSMALYFGEVANVSFVYLDRYVVGLFLSPTILGVYILYWSVTNALSGLVTTSYVQVQKGVLVKVAQAADGAFNRALAQICVTSSAMTLVLGLMATILMYLVVPYLGRPVAESYLPLMFVLVAGLVLRSLYQVLGISFYAHGRDDLALYTVLGVLVVALGLNLWWDPRIGIWGAGFALVASYAIGVAVRGGLVLRGFRLRPPATPQIRGAMAPAGKGSN